MSEPSHAWPAAEQAPAPPLAAVPDAVMPPHGAPPHAPPQHVQPPTAPAPLPFEMPTTAGAMLNVAAPLAMAAPPAEPNTAFAAHLAGDDPVYEPAPLAPDAHAADAVAEPTEASVDISKEWWSPTNALVLGMLGLMLQLVSFYGAKLLPGRVASGAPLDRFDTIVSGVPLLDSVVGTLLATLIAAGALYILREGLKRGVRQRGLQGAAAGVAGFAVLCAVLPGLLFGP